MSYRACAMASEVTFTALAGECWGLAQLRVGFGCAVGSRTMDSLEENNFIRVLKQWLERDEKWGGQPQASELPRSIIARGLEGLANG